MTVVDIKEKQIEKIGREMGDAYVLLAKSYMAAHRAAIEIARKSNNKKCMDRLIKMDQELMELQLMYDPNIGKQ